MSEHTVEQKRLDSTVLSTALLDEIAERLLSIERIAKGQNPEGVVEPIEKFNITQAKTRILRIKPWFSLSLINDDDNHSVYTIVNTAKSFDEHEVKPHETYTIDMKHGVIEDLLLWCNPNETAAVRIVGTR